MSFEYLIINKNGDSGSLFDFVANGINGNRVVELMCFNDSIKMKDVTLGGAWDYDVRLIRQGDNVSVILVGWSCSLYNVLHSALSGAAYQIFDEDSEEIISIEKMFRMN